MERIKNTYVAEWSKALVSKTNLEIVRGFESYHTCIWFYSSTDRMCGYGPHDEGSNPSRATNG